MGCEDCKNYELTTHKIKCRRCGATKEIGNKAYKMLRMEYTDNPLWLLDALLKCSCKDEPDWCWVI